MRKLIFILFIFIIIYSCSKTKSTPTLTTPDVIKLSGCDSIRQELLKTTSDTVRLVSCVSITGCDSVRLGILKPNTQDTLRLLSCIELSGCDSVRLGLLKSTKDLLRINCNSSSITIGTQKWMIVNLDIETYRNGDIIPQVTDLNDLEALTTGAWCYYKNDPFYGAIYGKLYNWYAVNDPRGLAPKGWHIPTDSEWTTLITLLGGLDGLSGGKMKTTGTTRWSAPNTNATNESGFAGLPGGYLNFLGEFVDVGDYGVWWSASQHTSSAAWFRLLAYSNGSLARSYGGKTSGFSVRCLKD